MLRDLEQILAEQKKKNMTSLSVAVTMLIAGIVLLIAKQALGWLFIILSVIIAAGLISGRKSFEAELAKAGGKKSLAEQLGSADAQEFERFSLTLTPELAVISYPGLKVYRISDMEKFEVGLGNVQKALFLTDASGKRSKIAETQTGDGKQEEFDRLYERVREMFRAREDARL